MPILKEACVACEHLQLHPKVVVVDTQRGVTCRSGTSSIFRSERLMRMLQYWRDVKNRFNLLKSVIENKSSSEMVQRA